MIIDKKLLDEVSAQAKSSPRLRMNYNLHDNLDAKAQRLLNASETYMLLRGKIRVMFYNETGVETESFLLDPLCGNYGIQIPVGQWHTLEVLEGNSVIFEVKDGPYTPLAPEDLMQCKRERNTEKNAI